MYSNEKLDVGVVRRQTLRTLWMLWMGVKMWFADKPGVPYGYYGKGVPVVGCALLLCTPIL